MSYEKKRAYFTHSVLGNGFFSYLSEPPSLWKSRDLTFKERARRLSDNWQGIFTRPNSLKHAYQVWRGINRDGRGIEASAWELYDIVLRDPLVQPTSNFPTRELLSCWLSTMQVLMEALASSEFKYHPDQHARVQAFWEAGISLYEFFQGTKFGGESFWKYFEPKTKL